MNWYKDRAIQADAGIFRSLFPEQTRTLPRIIVWSIIFLMDLILGVAGAFRFGLLDHSGKLGAAILLGAIVGIFWLQGKIWYGIVRYFQKRNTLD